MRPRPTLLLCLAVAACLPGCASDAPSERAAQAQTTGETADREKALILAVLNAETRDALSRDYQGWRCHWVHEPYVVKTYVNAADGTGSETMGWADVDAFVRAYIDAHPEPEPPPSPLEDADVRLYGDGAWVSYEQDDADQGRKRESRLMEKVDGAWRIAAMHTTVYGPAQAD